MKNPLYAVLLLFCFFSSPIFAQQVFHQQSCITASQQAEIDSLRQVFTTQGFTLVREAYVNMESDYEMPVSMQLHKGSWYHFVFIGDTSSASYELRMFDEKDREILYKKHGVGDTDVHIIHCSYSPGQSQSHFFKPSQVNNNKSKRLYGYVMMFKKLS